MALMGSANDTTLSQRLRDLIARQPAGRCLLGEFYSDEELYQLDCQRVWRTGWLFAGHSCEIPNSGDYFALQVDTDSILITRDKNGQVHALHNVCRHRGSRICDGTEGQIKRLVCPYHRWTYDLDGTL